MTKELTRYGLEWAGPTNFISRPMDDGYWTPWHEAQERIAEFERRLLRATVLATKHCPREHHDWAEIVSFDAPKGTELVEDILRVRVDGLKDDLAAAQATIQRKDEALEEIGKQAALGPTWLAMAICATVEKALAIPADRSCLDAMLKEAEEKGWDAGHIAGREKSPTYKNVQELLDQVDALEREQDEYQDAMKAAAVAMNIQTEKLAAAQATISRKDEALRKVAQSLAWLAFGECRSFGEEVQLLKAGDADVVAREALALPSDRTALDAMLADARKDGMLKAEEIAEIVKCAPVACSSGNSREHIELVKKAIRQAAERGME